jgi:tyrosyl-tRNA synthetase
MQCADVFYLKTDICQLGVDQRKVNMLAREYCDKQKDMTKPIIVSHHMLSGMTKPKASEKAEDDSDEDDHLTAVTNKMSKSDPNSAIFMEDSEKEVIRKVKVAYCPPAMEFETIGKTKNRNPILDYCESIIFPAYGEMKIVRAAEHGGNVTFTKYEDLRDAYCREEVHPGDLKTTVAAAINKLLQPVRDHFENDPYARGLLEQIKVW